MPIHHAVAKLVLNYLLDKIHDNDRAIEDYRNKIDMWMDIANAKARSLKLQQRLVGDLCELLTQIEYNCVMRKIDDLRIALEQNELEARIRRFTIDDLRIVIDADTHEYIREHAAKKARIIRTLSRR